MSIESSHAHPDDETAIKMADLVAELGIKITATPGCVGDDEIGDDDWPKYAWTVRLALGPRWITVAFWTGNVEPIRSGRVTTVRVPESSTVKRNMQRKPPTAADVLSCLTSDASVPESFTDWCDDMGGDPDSRAAFATWEECRKLVHRLRAFLGADYDRASAAEH